LAFFNHTNPPDLRPTAKEIRHPSPTPEASEVQAKSGLIVEVVGASCRRAWIVVMLGALLGVLGFVYTASHFAMTADSLELISPDVPWRKNKAAFEKAFPQQIDVIAVVVDGATPELAERAAAALAARLSIATDLFRSVRQPEGGPFFDRDGILLLPVAEVESMTNQLIASQPFLGPLAADPSLRGVMTSLSTALLGVEHGQSKLEDLERAIRAFAESLGNVVLGKAAFFSWQTLIAEQAAGTRLTRRIVLVQPKVNNDVLLPGEEASEAIRQAAGELGLERQNGVSVRLTGPVVLADEEFATLAEHAVPMAVGTALGVCFMLWLALRSARIIAAILVTTFTGLVITAGLGLLLVGRFSLISVAFIPLFVGLGIDFAIQFSMRFRAERLDHPELNQALVATGAKVGGSLALAAGAMAVGFFAFLPTNYLGASELGLIAGVGMLVAFVLSVTFLPALLALARPRPEQAAIGFAILAPVDRFLLHRRTSILAIAAGVAVISLALLPLVRFDFNPLHLRNPKTESVSTLMDLMSDPDRTPNSIDVLAPSLTAADALAARLASLPEVDRTLTLSSFIPDHQAEKLAFIKDASTLLDLTLNPIEVQPPPSDAETAASLAKAAAALRHAAGSATSRAAEEARRLSTILDTLAQGSAALRSRAADTLITPLSVMLDRLRTMLQAQPVTLETLPPDLVRDWVASDGRARTQVFPRGDSNDNRTLERFSRAVQAVAPDATGAPISIQEAARMIVHAFIEAGIWSFLAITLLLAIVLRRVRDVTVTLVPILLSGLLTLASCVLIGQPLNFANIIALPLLFGIGVAFNIYFVMAWRSGDTLPLRSSLTRAVLFSALTTATAFGSLWLSSHPGTASMGKLLIVSLAWTLVTALLFEPALLGPPRAPPLSNRLPP
jgi:uncharacterized protein